MGLPVSFFARFLLSAAAIVAAAPVPTAPAAESVATVFKEVRIRKLHLVRPDLIPYPLAYEVFC